MHHRFSPVVILLAASLFVSADAPTRLSAALVTDPTGLIVHEWGTFTSVAGQDGFAQEWVPPQGPRDLPCFVDRLPSNIKGWMPATVRMETPVVYFYSPEEKTVDVRVRFRRGLITEWYPRASVTPGSIQALALKNPALEGTIAWNQVKVTPRAADEYPVESGTNHYYAARKTDASPLQVGTEREKFLFYRGIGNFALPLGALMSADGRVLVNAAPGVSLSDVMLFESRNGSAGYRIARSAGAQIAIERPSLDARQAGVRAALERMLVAHGLYAKEAAAMVETWRDSWFEDGLRLFYVVPRSSIDEVLPLEVTPAPASTARVFVGRIELITPAIVAEVKDGILRRDRAPIAKYGRFLRPILARITSSSTAAEAVTIDRNISFAYASAAPAPGSCHR
jgi:hypothetical protein